MHFRDLLLLALPILTTAIPTANLDGKREVDDDSFFYKGHDLSSLKLLEDGGSIFKDTTKYNQTRPAEDILGDGGMNTVRLRIWVNPSDGVNGLNYTIDLAKRFYKKGYKIYLDFHFADSWADPQKQPIPAAWPKTLEPLADTLETYVKNTLIAFMHAGVNLDVVALGNEIRHGILWPVGQVNVDVEPWSALVANFSNLATLYKAARKGVEQAEDHGVKKPKVLIHIDNGWNITLQMRWFGALLDNGIKTSDFDIMGFSFYPFYGTSATFENLRSSLSILAWVFKKPLQVVETDYPAICNGQYNPIPPSSEPEIPYDIAGQTTWVDDVIAIVKQVPYGLGRGVHYWEPAWLNNTSLGSACNDAILFSPDYSGFPQTVGYSRSSVNMFKHR